jgi:branched-chain amino acid transport system permease protein
MEYLVVTLLNGVSYGLLLFMLSSGLTLVFGMMGVLNFTHASFYMLGAYIAYTISVLAGFWFGLFVAPLLVGTIGALIERYGLRLVHRQGHVGELLFTFGLAYIIVEVVQVIWGRLAVPYAIPKELSGPLFTLYSASFSVYRGFMMGVALLMLTAIFVVLKFTRVGLVIQAALSHPDAVEALGHNVPRYFMFVFGGGAALAGLAGVIGGNAFLTDPAMAAAVGTIVFVIVVLGGLGSLAGALTASLLIGVLQTGAASTDISLAALLGRVGLHIGADSPAYALASLTPAEVAPILPYLLMMIVLIVRPKGLMGTRET